MLRFRPALALVLALAFAAGPVSAACLHGADHGMDAGHEVPGHPPADETPPCHGEPEAPAPEAPAPVDGCASACCTAEAAVKPLPPLPLTEADALLAVAVTEVLAEPATAPVPAPSTSPPRPPTPLYVVFERYLI